MNIILLSKSGGTTVRHVNSLAHFVVLGVFLLGAAAGLVYLGYWYGANQDPDGYVARWERALAEQRNEVQRVRQEAQADVEALTVNLGQIRGYVSRLDALGAKLVKMAKLESGEFNFGEPPGVGGPLAEADLGELVPLDFQGVLGDLTVELEQRHRELSVLERLLLDRNLQAEVRPAGRPTRSGWLSSGWGMRTDPFHGRPQFHRGLDFAGRKGQDVVAVAKGVVTFAGKRWGYGNMVEVNHGDGYSTRYAHNLENRVEAGDHVSKGDVIALMGTTGRSTGYHVHFEVLKDGKEINPSTFVASK